MVDRCSFHLYSIVGPKTCSPAMTQCYGKVAVCNGGGGVLDASVWRQSDGGVVTDSRSSTILRAK